MAKMDPKEQQLNPRWQYMHDLNQLIADYRDNNTDVIIVGDTNLNYHKRSQECDWWQNIMAQHKLANWMQQKWPEQIGTLKTWTNGVSSSWVDHVWMPAEQIRGGVLTRAGVGQIGGIS